MDRKEALELVAEIRKDSNSGVRIGIQSEIVLFLADEIARMLDDLAEEAQLQADWEFENNYDQPKARLTAEKIANAISKKYHAYKSEMARAEGIGPRGVEEKEK